MSFPLKIVFVVPGKNNNSLFSMSFVKRLARAISIEGSIVEMFFVGKTWSPISFFKQGFDLSVRVKEFEPDIVVAQYGTFSGLIVAFFAPRPKIITFRGTDLNPAPSQKRLYVFLEHVASHIASFFADGIICVSRELRNRLVFKKEVAIIPSSTDIDLFKPLDQIKCRNKLGWDVMKPIALFFVGNSPRIKRLDMALEIQKTLIDRGVDLEFRIIQEEIPLLEMPVYLNSADCLVFLSDFEGSPNLIREACACNTPVVTVLVGDVQEVLENIEPNRIVERNIKKIADAILELSLLRARTNGREHIQKFSNENTAKKTIEFYARIIARKDRN